MEQFLNDNGALIGIIVIALGGGYAIFRKQVNRAVFAAGKIFGAFLKRFKLDDEAEEIGQSFVDGMKSNDQPIKQDEANLFSPNMPTVTPERKEELLKQIEKTYPNNIGGDK